MLEGQQLLVAQGRQVFDRHPLEVVLVDHEQRSVLALLSQPQYGYLAGLLRRRLDPAEKGPDRPRGPQLRLQEQAIVASIRAVVIIPPDRPAQDLPLAAEGGRKA